MGKYPASSAEFQSPLEKPAARVLIVDDHVLLRDGMRMLIDNEPDLEVCGEAEDEAEAAQIFRRLRPDLVIVDIALKTGNGIELIKRITAHDPAARTIVLSMHDERIYAERALRAGARGFVCKQDPGSAILNAVRRVLDGEMYFSDQMTQRLLVCAAEKGDPGKNSPVDLLADRELEAFALIGKGLASREIAARMHISQKTVDRYRENIKKKLGIATSNELVHRATLWCQQNE